MSRQVEENDFETIFFKDKHLFFTVLADTRVLLASVNGVWKIFTKEIFQKFYDWTQQYLD